MYMYVGVYVCGLKRRACVRINLSESPDSTTPTHQPTNHITPQQVPMQCVMDPYLSRECAFSRQVGICFGENV